LALKILIADNDPEELQALKEYFSAELYQVETANSGKDVQLKLYQEKYFALLMNWSVQNHSAGQVLSFTKKNMPGLKVIILLNDLSLLDESADQNIDSIKKMGAHQVMVKPFERKDVKSELEGHQSMSELMGHQPRREGVSDELELDGKDEDFTAIKINEFFSAKSVLFDVFIRLRENRYVKILHAGDTFSKERIAKYRDEKKVQYLYFQNKDRKKFIQFNNYLIDKTLANAQIPTVTKANMLKNVSSQYLEEVHVEGLKPQVLEQGREICESIFQFVDQDKKLHHFLRDLHNLDPSSYSHSFLVTLYVTSITKQFDWQSPQTIQSMAMACLLHDIGKTKIPKELLLLRPIQMNDEQLALYHQHPQLGFDLLKDNKLVNNTVKQVILQHHETYDGTGYPAGLKGSRILMMANIVCLVDDFVHLMLDAETSPVETLKTILVDKEMAKRYHSSILENFIKVFVDPEKIMKDRTLPSNSKVLNKKAS